MSDFLDTIVARATGNCGVRPRVPGWFEPVEAGGSLAPPASERSGIVAGASPGAGDHDSRDKDADGMATPVEPRTAAPPEPEIRSARMWTPPAVDAVTNVNQEAVGAAGIRSNRAAAQSDDPGAGGRRASSVLAQILAVDEGRARGTELGARRPSVTAGGQRDADAGTDVEGIGAPDAAAVAAPTRMRPEGVVTKALRPTTAGTTIEPAIRPVLTAAPDRAAYERGSRATDSRETTIHVTIGRVEVRAASQPPQEARRRPSGPNVLPLDEYLRRRRGGL
ncbi:MAG TPA: hypothetical protein PKE42_01915 [Arachnia sp.]|nr:hypothetical protein [Arachnia sp.]